MDGGSAEEVAHIHFLFLCGGRRGRGGFGGILGFVGFFICDRFSCGGGSSNISEEFGDALSLEGLGNGIDQA